MAAPLDPESLNALALRYVERYATSEAKLAAYLKRKLRERGWAGERAAAVDALVARLAEVGLVSDRSFAEMKAAGLARRGYGAARVRSALGAAGIGQDLRAEVSGAADPLAAAEAYARRRRLGRFRAGATSPEQARRDMAAMLRAGHGWASAKAALGSGVAELDEAEAEADSG